MRLKKYTNKFESFNTILHLFAIRSVQHYVVHTILNTSYLHGLGKYCTCLFWNFGLISHFDGGRGCHAIKIWNWNDLNIYIQIFVKLKCMNIIYYPKNGGHAIYGNLLILLHCVSSFGFPNHLQFSKYFSLKLFESRTAWKRFLISRNPWNVYWTDCAKWWGIKTIPIE